MAWTNDGTARTVRPSATGGTAVPALPEISVEARTLRAPPGGRARLAFAVPGRWRPDGYRVRSADGEAARWCRVRVPAGAPTGELVVEVPGEASPGRHRLRLVATAGGRPLARADLTLHVEGASCLRLLGAPELELRPDGTVEASLRLLNCGAVDARVELVARHEGGWRFTVDAPEMTIEAGRGPVTVQVTLRPPDGRAVRRGDGVDVDVATGAGTESATAHVDAHARPPRWRPSVKATVALSASLGLAVTAWAGAGADDSGPRTTRPAFEVAATVPPVAASPTTVPRVDGDPGSTTTAPPAEGDPTGPPVTPAAPTVPDVVGEPLGDARATVEREGFVVEVTSVDAPDGEPGTVVGQSPVGGTAADAGSTVTLHVPAAEVTLVVVPQVTRSAEHVATRMLSNVPLGVDDVTHEFHPDLLSGQAIRTEPIAGTEVASGSPVDLVMSKGRDPGCGTTSGAVSPCEVEGAPDPEESEGAVRP